MQPFICVEAGGDSSQHHNFNFAFHFLFPKIVVRPFMVLSLTEVMRLNHNLFFFFLNTYVVHSCIVVMMMIFGLAGG